MCNILFFKKGKTIPYDMLETCVYNNMHSYGVVLKDTENKKLEIIKKCHKDGNDPKEIYDLINDNKEFERYVHLRWRTDGPIDLENTHPFTAYHSDNRTVLFMHNGVLHNFKPKIVGTTWENNVRKDVLEEDASDSKLFNDRFLAPFLNRFEGENGKADIHDPVFQDIFVKFWGISSTNRGVLISSDQEPVFIELKEWKKFELPDECQFLSSNDTYFKEVTRGPIFLQREREKTEKALQERLARARDGQNDDANGKKNGLRDIKDCKFDSRVSLTGPISEIMSDWDLYEPEGLAALDVVTDIEWKGLVDSHPDEMVLLISHLSGEYAKLQKNHSRAVEYLKTLKGKHPEEIEVLQKVG